METLQFPRFLLSRTAPRAGTFVVGLGIVLELRRRGVSVSCAIIGPNLMQAMVFRRICGRYVRCLDSRLLSSSQNLMGLYRAGVGADVVMVLGSAGLYDGPLGDFHKSSDANFAALAQCPAVVVANAADYGATMAACIKGLESYADSFTFSGAILNQVQGGEKLTERKELFDDAFLTAGIEQPLGVIPYHDGFPELPPREIHQATNLTSLPHQFFLDAGRLAGNHVDIDRIIAAAEHAHPVSVPEFDNRPSATRTKIAVTDDSCFHLCFQDNLDLLRYYGAELVPFSPLADEKLPSRIGGVYITGAYLDAYGGELTQNTAIQRALLDFYHGGGVIYSEGAGTAYLCNRFLTSGAEKPLTSVGIIPASAYNNPVGITMSETVSTDDTILGASGLILKGLNTNEWVLEEEQPLLRTLRLLKPGSRGNSEGYSPGPQVLNTFSFMHFGSNPKAAKAFVDSAEVVCSLA